ncbi:MAG TPA: GntR family transcriptional regulator, partial [Alicycliphilus sp.]|nr:GntR family transcriptional regulator [Alicycliphilus sp.]
MNAPTTGLPEPLSSAALPQSSLRGKAGRGGGRSLANLLSEEFENKIRQGLLREGEKLP